ncbi:unnamed protein product [Rotaria sp. Silwood2]|nr:unnamed protein product [Rotaria sp. Silwood2]
MYERCSSMRSETKTDDDNDPLLISRTDDQQHEPILINILNETIVDTNSINEENSVTEPLLNENRVESPVTGTFLCSNIPARYIIATWAFFGFFCLYAMRVNLSVAIVAMVTPQSALNESVQSCLPQDKNSTTPPPRYEFDWSPTIEGIVLGAFFYGYIIMQL